ncbi:hypothetical protein [Alteromonas oceanisediminis]|uniref:hypothetical protein n=1 Tax=Alteromonas oceanisediminis TaxID=2836180 RepID=UPI001BD99929|nr:hypothetical protein [Alteromonas oceanisediminis]MBT0586571.1 hypothetical protein [Alteromonas oceanisediminis]
MTCSAINAAASDDRWAIGYVPSAVFFTDSNKTLQGSLAPLNQCFLNHFDQFELIEMPNFERLARSLKAHQVDIALNMSRSHPRDQIATYMGHQFGYDIVKVSNTRLSSLKSVGLKRGDADTAQFITDNADVKFVYLKGTEQLMGSFNLARIDSFIDAAPILLDALKSTDLLTPYRMDVVANAHAGIYVSNASFKRVQNQLPEIRSVLVSCSKQLPDDASGFNPVTHSVTPE